MKSSFCPSLRLSSWLLFLAAAGVTLHRECDAALATDGLPKKGFILTSPKVLIAGANETLCLSLFGTAAQGHVNITLENSDERHIIAKSNHPIKPGNNDTCFVVTMPPLTGIKSIAARLNIDGRFEDDYQIHGSTRVSIEKTPPITFIQTDKPIYKPGQIVQLRVLRLDVNLTPSKEMVAAVWIEDPTGVRVAMWNNPKSEQGLVELSMKLSDEPPLGDWTITAQHESGNELKKFVVKEYVLPKFSIDIISPPCIVPAEESSHWKICSKYSYGQPVIGNLTVTASLRETLRRFGPRRQSDNFTLAAEIMGCEDIVIDRNNLTELRNAKGWSHSFHLFAEVIEKGTGIKMNASKNLEIRTNPYKVTLKHNTHFKPGLNFYGTALVSFVDGRPAPNTKLSIAIQAYEKHGVSKYHAANEYVADENGEISFTVAPQSSNVERFRIKTTVLSNSSASLAADDYSSSVTLHSIVHSWHSPSKSFVQLEVNPENNNNNNNNNRPLTCSKRHPITVSSIFAKDLSGHSVVFNYQVFARGEHILRDQIQYSVDPKAHETNRTNETNGTGDFFPARQRQIAGLDRGDQNPAGNDRRSVIETLEIELDVDARMSPESKIVVFYVRPDGEVVSDYANIKVENCFDNKVEISLANEEVLPGTPTKIKVEAHPKSLCAVSAVDQSVHLLSGNDQFNAESVFAKVTNFNHNKKFKPYESDLNGISCLKEAANLQGPPFEYTMFDSVSTYMDAMESFKKAGIAVISDLTLITRPCRTIRPLFHPGPSWRTGVIAYNSETRADVGILGATSVVARTDMKYDGVGSAVSSRHPLNAVVSKSKSESKEDASSSTIIAKPAVEIRDFFPETWLWELHKIGKDGTVKFEREIPHSVTTWTANTFCTSSEKGLGISNAVSIRSFQPFFLSYSMPYSVKNGEQVPLKVSLFNYLSKCFTVRILIEKSIGFEVSGHHEEKACVCGHRSHTHTFTLRPKKMGHLNVTVHAHSIGEQNTTSLCENGTTEADVIAHDAITKPLLVKAQGLPKEIVNTTMFCPKDDEIYSSIYTLVLPQNVVEGSARAYVRIIGDLMGPSVTGLDKLVKLPTGCGEQNMVLFVPNIFVLKYLQNTNQLMDDVRLKALDHLASGYQRQLTYKHKDGSYSAFGDSDKEGSTWLTAFVLKSFAQARTFTYVDPEELSKTMAYVKNLQMENGCFESRGRLLSKAMKGGLESGQSSDARALTAYVIVALLEAGMSPSSDVIKEAFVCLEAESEPTLYLLALKTYASALVDSADERAWNNWKELERKSSQKDGLMHWGGDDSSPAVNIEITSYALMALTEINSPPLNVKALSIVRWLAQQRNANGGFVSTQDTVLALQALSGYAAIAANKSLNTAIEVKIETDDLDDTVYVNEANKLVMQTRRLSHFPTVLDVEATGTGCALLEVTLKYNIEEETVQDAFALDVNVDCDKERIHICTKYRNEDEKSNMAVVEVNMLSGYEALKGKLNELKNDANSPIKRADVNEEGTVNLYFDELTLQELCFDVDVHKTLDVKDVKPAFISVYDYYQPEYSTSKYYSFDYLSACMEKLPGRSAVTSNCTDGNHLCPRSGRSGRNSRKAILEKPVTLFDKKSRVGDTLKTTLTNPSRISESSIPRRQQDCPACLKKFPTNFAQLLCYGDIAVIAEIRNNTARRMKLRSNAHSSLEKFQRINVVTRYEIAKSCDCDLLNNGQHVLIVGKLPRGAAGIPEPIKFNREVSLIKLDPNALKTLRRFHQQCQN